MKKGFTLAELIGVIVVLALISLVTVPAVSKTLKDNKVKLCLTQLENIKTAGEVYKSENLWTLGDTNIITLKELIKLGYIDGPIINPLTKDEFDEDATIITIKKTSEIYEVTLDEATIGLCTPS